VRTDPAHARIALDRELIQRRGFREFVRRAWPEIEPNVFVDSWHIGAICEHLEALARGQIMDLCICQPPGSSKSLIASTLFPSWDWIGNPSRRYISASYAQTIAEKNAKLQRDLVSGEWYRARWPGREIGKDDLAKVRMFANRAGGWRFSTSVTGEVTGRHADVLLGDDLAKAQDVQGRHVIDPIAIQEANTFWFNTLQTRRANPAQTRRLLIGQRLHMDDTPGRAIDAGYVALILPMEYDPRRSCVTVLGFKDPRTVEGELLLPERFPASVVAEDKERLGPRDHAAQNNQDPVRATGSMFKNVAGLRWSAVPKSARTIITCDAAFKAKATSDFVSIQVWAVDRPRFFLIDDRTKRRTFSETVQALRDVRKDYPGVGIYVEDKANGPAIMDTLKDELTGIVAWDPGQASKISRAEAKAHLFEAGNVYLPPDEKAPWLAEYMNELHAFPNGKNDDRVDATTMALMVLDSGGIARYAEAVAAMAKGAFR
jgi:predicted phage terminase large subunit-like protein